MQPEYKVESIMAGSLEARLNELAADGWVLDRDIMSQGSNHFIFVREKRPEEKPEPTVDDVDAGEHTVIDEHGNPVPTTVDVPVPAPASATDPTLAAVPLAEKPGPV